MFFHQVAGFRHYSTSGESKRLINFEDYKKLKKRLKWTARVAGIPGFAVFSGISAAVNVHYFPDIMNLEAAEVQPVFGMDPIVFASLCGLGAGSVGFFAGASLFNAMWRVLFRSKYRVLKERDEDFLQRIQKYRYSEFSRYEDDYYGDKIMTLSDYRQWVRQQQKRRESMQKLEGDKDTEKKNDGV